MYFIFVFYPPHK